MRPPLTPSRHANIPRSRQRRAADFRALGFAYIITLVLFTGLVWAVCFARGGLAHHAADFSAYAMVAFCIVAYLAGGGVVVGLAIQRLAKWNSLPPGWTSKTNWLLVLFWPLAVGVLLLNGVLAGAA